MNIGHPIIDQSLLFWILENQNQLLFRINIGAYVCAQASKDRFTT